MEPKTKPLRKKTAEELETSKKETEARTAKWVAESQERERRSVPEAIAQLRNEAADKTAEADRLDKLYREFPDLVRTVGRWQKVAYSSKSVNAVVDSYDMRYNCGCCDDSPLEVWPYKKTEIGPVYSYPAKFTVGEKNYLGGDTPSLNWDAPMRAAHIPEEVITKVKEHFKKCRDDLIHSANELYEEKSSEEPEPLL